MKSMDDSHRSLLDKIKSVHSDLKNAINNNTCEISTLKELKSGMAQIHKDLGAARRQAAMEKEEFDVTVAIMREEMRDELVEREAVSARTAERFRAFCSRGSPEMQSAFDRASRTAFSIDACVNALSCESPNFNRGTALLHQQAVENDRLTRAGQTQLGNGR